jgi:hypothetical protein
MKEILGEFLFAGTALLGCSVGVCDDDDTSAGRGDETLDEIVGEPAKSVSVGDNLPTVPCKQVQNGLQAFPLS